VSTLFLDYLIYLLTVRCKRMLVDVTTYATTIQCRQSNNGKVEYINVGSCTHLLSVYLRTEISDKSALQHVTLTILSGAENKRWVIFFICIFNLNQLLCRQKYDCDRELCYVRHLSPILSSCMYDFLFSVVLVIFSLHHHTVVITKWSGFLATTASLSLTWGWWSWPPDLESRCEYIE
jgi:hypothetical protein